MCNGIPVFAIANFGEHGNSESIPAFQTYGLHVIFTINLQIPSVRAWFYVNKIDILEVCKAKIDWLQQRSCRRCIQERQLSSFSNSNDHKVIQQRNLSYVISLLTNNCTDTSTLKIKATELMFRHLCENF